MEQKVRGWEIQFDDDVDFLWFYSEWGLKKRKLILSGNILWFFAHFFILLSFYQSNIFPCLVYSLRSLALDLLLRAVKEALSFGLTGSLILLIIFFLSSYSLNCLSRFLLISLISSLLRVIFSIKILFYFLAYFFWLSMRWLFCNLRLISLSDLRLMIWARFLHRDLF